MHTPTANTASLAELLERVEPGAVLVDVESPTAAFSNATVVATARTRGGSDLRLVLRRYAPSEHDPPAARARREHAALTALRSHGLPVPEPLLLDTEVSPPEGPVLVTSYVAGSHRVGHERPHEWARATAAMLARIHAVPWAAAAAHLLDGRREATWFAGPDEVPGFLAASPGGETVWRRVREALPRTEPSAPCLLHLDYWAGNLLWRDGGVAAVLDWEEAAVGDAGIDVAYARLELCLLGLDAAADTFLAVYETEVGHAVEDLGLWELAAAARAMPDPGGWVREWVELGAVGCDDATAWERLGRFVARAARRLD